MLKQNLLSSIRHLIFCMFLLPAVCLAAQDPFAPPVDPTQQGLSNILAAINNLIGGYGTGMSNAILQAPSYDIQNLQAGGAAQEQLNQIPFDQAQPLTLKGILRTLTTVDDATTINTATKILAPVTKSDKDASKNSKNLDMNSLLGVLQYDKNQADEAANFITLVSGLGNPMPVIDFSNIPADKLRGALSNPQIASYLVALRTYTAQQAVGLSNLYHSYGERLPNADVSALIKTWPALTPTALSALPANPSALQVREYLAKRRLLDANWYTQMSVASPIEVQRQTLYLLAEMRAEMFQQEMETERLNTTLSVLVLQNAAASRLLLMQQVNAAQPIVRSLRTSSQNQPTQPSPPNYSPPNYQQPQTPASGSPSSGSSTSGSSTQGNSSSDNNNNTPSQ